MDELARLLERRHIVDSLLKLSSVSRQLIGQRGWHATHGLLSCDQPFESLLHFALDLVSLNLYLAHLFFDLVDALADHVRVEVVFHQRLVEAAAQHGIRTRLSPGEGVLLQLNYLLQLVDLAADVRRAGLRVLV